jgi:hypothetical protein
MENNPLFTSLKDASNESLMALREQNKDSESVVTLVDSILKAREVEELANIGKLEFVASVADLINLPAPPQGVYNLFLAWQEVEIPVGEPEEVEVSDGKNKKHMETRQATEKVMQWVITTNHACKVGKTTSGEKAAPKRSITVYKREGLNLEPVGNFDNGKNACEHLNLTVGGDSALRVLAREGYIVEPYNG